MIVVVMVVTDDVGSMAMMAMSVTGRKLVSPLCMTAGAIDARICSEQSFP